MREVQTRTKVYGMSSAIRHSRCRGHIDQAEKLKNKGLFHAAAREVVEATKDAVFTIDLFEVYLLRRDLVERHGVNWELVLKENKL